MDRKSKTAKRINRKNAPRISKRIIATKAIPARQYHPCEPEEEWSLFDTLLQGIAMIFPEPSRRYNDPTGGGFSVDHQSIKNDFSRIGKDMEKTIRKHG